MDEAISLDIRNALRLSLKSSGDLAQVLDAPQGRGPTPEHLRKLIEVLLWHRRFIVTYYAVIGVVVAISCGVKIYKNIKRWTLQRHEDGGDTVSSSGTVSSSSSTLRGTVTPPTGKNDDLCCGETTPLLLQDSVTRPRRPLLLHRLKAFLLYQPRPIRALTSPSNVLPDNGTSLLLIFFLGVNLFYLLYRSPLTISWIFILADRAGLLFVVNLPVLYILAAKTNQPIKLITGWSYEGLNLFHRRLGEWMIVISIVHMLGMFVVWYTILRPLDFDLFRYLTEPVVFVGISAIISYFIIYITSVGWFRHLYYEAFLGLHIFFQVAALAFLFFHYPTARPYVLATLSIWVIDRLVWRISLSSRKYLATLEVAPDDHTVLLHCDIDLQRTLLGTRVGLHHGWLPGQHVFVTIPSMGFKYRFQTHPFTISSPAPGRNAGAKSWPLQLVIRSIDGFSLDLLKYARHHQHCEVIMDGPHGGIEALEAAHEADRVCFVAGGSGIAVTYPLAWDVRVEGVMQPEALVSTRTMYREGIRSTQSVIDCGPLVKASDYAHFWVRQDPSHAKWISVFPRASSVKQEPAMKSHARSAEGNLGQEEVASIVTRSFDTRVPLSEGGRPDVKGEVWNWVTSTSSTRSSSSTLLRATETDSAVLEIRDSVCRTAGSKGRDKICIIVSGPDGLVRDVRNVVAQLVQEGWDIYVYVEKFGW
ncbi:hypothetical protein PV08_02807 [Exophiala spinifera]|uniref:FAD-binding FR-type domain-containing protein n=1 Tax=Exophiala spinifera TaxID=91928 RepID=A0A0D2C4M9_9EURO|nr:uncharacterized protein PV08_02807 [Exophiala spinifera]KIW18519.1 hypothetical protein PV08_02807 [Exophiala spinifera]